MNIYLVFLIECTLAIAGILLLLWVLLWLSARNRRIDYRSASLKSEELEDHAHKAAIKHTISRKRSILDWPLPRLDGNRDRILAVYRELNEDIRQKRDVPASSEWLLDNYYVIDSQVNVLGNELNKRSYHRLPVLRAGPFKGFARIYAVVVELLTNMDGKLDESALSDYLKTYQTHNVLFEREIRALPIVVSLAILEIIRQLCDAISDTRLQWGKANWAYKAFVKDTSEDAAQFKAYLKTRLKTIDDIDSAFMEHLWYRLRHSGRNHMAAMLMINGILEKMGTTAEEITLREHNAQSMITVSMGNCITSLHHFASLDWSELFQAASQVEQILGQDPSRTYPEMDSATRDRYREQVEVLAVLHSCSEIHIAKEAVALTKLACEDNPEHRRTGHVGYYLVDKGRKMLEARQEGGRIFFPAHDIRFRGPLYLWAIGLITAILVSVVARHAASLAVQSEALYALLSALVVLIPASEVAVSFVNRMICRALKPTILPKMELKSGIPESLSTIVAIPTLLPDASRVRELLKTMEGHYLRNREEHLYFALIGAFRDADTQFLQGDEAVIATALQGVKKLNDTYRENEHQPDKFYFFHRERVFNKSNNIWIGWERKRGALMEFNDLVLGAQDTSFCYASCKAPPFRHVKYVITLDSDTLLPMGTAKGLVGTMAHPLNTPTVDEQRGIVTEGFGLLQPRIDIDVESASKSLFSRIFASQEGIDPYSGAVSDVYQDMFGEGIFTGKGIYDLRVFQNVLKKAIPDNTVLSHDLLEGSYARAGLATDYKLVDGFPSRYQAYATRAHRWIRGDWQLLPLLFYRIQNGRGRIRNPLTPLSKWKMFDNLRRSILAPSRMLLVLLGLSVLPGAGFWLGALALATGFPLIGATADGFLSLLRKSSRTRPYMPIMDGIKSVFFQCLLNLAFLPHQAWLATHAVFVTLTRLFITKQNMLEWIPSADVEKNQLNTPASYAKAMWPGPLAAVVLLLSATPSGIAAVWLCMPLALLWAASPVVAYWVSRDQARSGGAITPEDRTELRRIARKTWRYFEEFAESQTHFLAPDNYQEDPPKGIAHRTSPTNIGLGLLAVLAARDMGYIGTIEMMGLVEKTISTMEGLAKWNGHLYNWYDTRTLKPLHPAYVSTVDSGNLAGYLITLEQGLRAYLESPLLDARFLDGLKDTLSCAGKAGDEQFERLTANFPCAAAQPDAGVAENDWISWRLAVHSLSTGFAATTSASRIWEKKAKNMTLWMDRELSDYLPGLALLGDMPKGMRAYAEKHLGSDVAALIECMKSNPALGALPEIYRRAEGRLADVTTKIDRAGQDFDPVKADWLEKLYKAVKEAAETVTWTAVRYQDLLARIQRLGAAMRFAPLYNKKKKLFSIGYHAEEGKLTNAHYDLLASEARLASYCAIAKGELPTSHWFRMGRALTVVDQYKGLISWTGTMFEYLMPLLIMKSYPNTLLDETYSFVLKSQIKYGRTKKMPWGTSESSFNALDKKHDYQYKAIGIPWLGLKRGLVDDAVAAPYATFLALQVDPQKAMENIGRLRLEGLDGPYGFYEAADYTPERLYFETKRAIVKSFMAHHQGMSLLAIDNCLHQNVMQERFHADPAIHAYRLLLQEKIPADMVIAKVVKEKVTPAQLAFSREDPPIRVFPRPDLVLPKVHILSNGNYSVMVTDRGTGYSRSKVAALTRWREDAVLDPYGMFIYLRNTATNELWSSAYAPLNRTPEQYKAVFSDDKVTFKRVDKDISTQTEIFVASGDNTEVRRVSLRNNADTSAIIELTSYFEVVLNTQAADLAHPTFSNLFVETSYHAKKGALIAKRRPRTTDEKGLWIGHFVVQEGKDQKAVQYETDRAQFLGRGHTPRNPDGLERGKPLSNTVGAVLDPIMSMRVGVRIEAGKTAAVSFVTILAESRELLLSLIDQYACPEDIGRASFLAFARSRVETMYRSFHSAEMVLFQEMLSHILFLSPTRRRFAKTLEQNTLGQSSLWRFGISGDCPILLVVLRAESQMSILYEAIKAHEYWRLMDVETDLVIVSVEEHGYANPLYTLVQDIVAVNQHNVMLQDPGDIFVLDRKDMRVEEMTLLIAAARIVLEGGMGTMREQLVFPEQLPLPDERAPASEPIAYPVEPAGDEGLMYDNGLGGFRADGKEYIMRIDKEHSTPMPWVNVIANPHFGFTASESGSGYTWYGNSHEYRLTPWFNDAVSDTPGEAIYLSDRDTGACWTPTLLPIRGDGMYQVQHGFGYSVYTHTAWGIEQSLTQFVPTADSVKISLLRLRNATKHARKLSVTYYIRPVLGEREQGTAMHIKSGVAPCGALVIENPYQEDFPGRICFVDASCVERSVTGDRREFFGSGDIAAPECLRRDRLSGSVGAGFDPCGAMRMEITLAPWEEKELVLLLGTACSEAEVKTITDRYNDIEKAKDALKEVRQSWLDRLGVVQVDTPNDAMNLMLNGWLQYQVVSCRLWARTGFYQSGGAYGFRDQLQDVLALTVVMPEAARAQILLHARHQFLEGDVQHWWHEPQGRGVRTRFSDDLLWLPYVAAEYVRITGDTGILKEVLPYLVEAPLSELESERYGSPAISGTASTLYDHCTRAIDLSLRFGEHGLPLMGSGDWNDGMNTVGNKGRGESVWLAWFLASVLDRFTHVCKEMKDDKTASYYAATREGILRAVERDGWDGSWYRRAYFDDGSPLGSARNRDCKIDSISQSWSVISGGDPQRSCAAMASLADYLINWEDGLCKLLAPPFDEGESEPGYIKGYVPGVRENGGQYTHAAAWAIIALAMMGDGDKSVELFDLINPIHHTNTYREYMKYKAEPFVMAADVYAVHPHTGRGGWSWYTGAASWMYQAGLEHILGLRKVGDVLSIDPCIPGKWKEFGLRYTVCGTIYHIRISNPDRLQNGVRRITVDGRATRENKIVLVYDKMDHYVDVLMGYDGV